MVMKGVRFISGILFYLARMASLLVVLVTTYATAVLLLYRAHSSFSPSMEVLANGSFRIFFPFTHSPFILGDYTGSFLFSSFFTVAFYGLFLWFLSSVFQAFRETRLFTKKGV